ncbi:hypothetical protein GCM10010472_10990 [Pseudonocardia halophobica]|uniref:Uncharacterized protein n=1 Tax=Pseudonocardia halophobica TaxID=29401 RepID=A0A9W6L4G2_9PSEU|nr:hypothetical protein [Pseudonocardia halophobica]GLL13486.1 hypothetical protein GCM10017577_46300 [Pseudonocardia halophobica]
MIEPVTDDLAAYVKAIVDTAPPLSEEQRNRISALLREEPGTEATAAAA